MWGRSFGWFRGTGAMGPGFCGCGGPTACAGYAEPAHLALSGTKAWQKRALEERASELREELSDIEEALKEEG